MRIHLRSDVPVGTCLSGGLDSSSIVCLMARELDAAGQLAKVNSVSACYDEQSVDERRFRMLIEIDGVDWHAEDAWVGRRTRVGGAVIAWRGHVGRCLITSRDPDTGKVDLPTLDILRGYRGHIGATEPLPFGIYGAVIEPGTVRLGDPVTLV